MFAFIHHEWFEVSEVPELLRFSFTFFNILFVFIVYKLMYKISEEAQFELCLSCV